MTSEQQVIYISNLCIDLASEVAYSPYRMFEILCKHLPFTEDEKEIIKCLIKNKLKS